MPKSVFIQDEAKSGANINFLKLQRLLGRENNDRLNMDKNKKYKWD
jgi:hypothetical protein